MGYLSDLTGGAAAILLLYYLIVAARLNARRRQLIKEHSCEEPPSRPSKDPFFGIDLFLSKIKDIKSHTLLRSQITRFEEYGHTYTEKSFGKTTLFTIDPENLKTYYNTNFKDYGVQRIRRKPFYPLLGDGVFSLDGPAWEHSRSLIRPTFTRFNVANFPALEVHFQRFLKLVPRDGKTVDLMPLLSNLFLDTSSEFIFGESINVQSDPSGTQSQANKFLDNFHHAQHGIAVRFQMGALSFLYQDRWDRKEREAVHKFVDAHIDKVLEIRRQYLTTKKSKDAKINSDIDGEKEEEKEGEKHRYILLHEMAKETNNRTELRNQTLHVFLAGHEATAIGIGNALFWLCRYPRVWEKLRKEVLGYGRDHGELTFEGLKGMRYLQWVVNETLRLTPIAPTITRIATHDTILPHGGGPSLSSPILVKKNTIISPNSYAFHRLAKCYNPDPEVFRPERWEDIRPGWNYLPFGGGVRICPGRNLGLTECAWGLARLCGEWRELECRDEEEEWVESMKLSAESGNGVKVGVVWA